MPRYVAVLLIALVMGTCLPTSRAAAQSDPRFFPQTGYRVDEAFWEYFQRRGGVRTFGYPVSNTFVLLGFRTQIFPREILQQQPTGAVSMMNVLDEGLMPYTTVNGSTFPGLDPDVINRQPAVGAPDYHVKALQFVKETAPDVWQGMKVNFYQTFSSSVRFEDAFPHGNGDAGLLSGFNLEVWGLPTSKPTPDPSNAGFVYQRFQRGIMHFDSATGQTQGLLLADYVKSLLTLQNLPADLASQASKNPLYGQFDPRVSQWLSRPRDLPGSDLSNAFDVPATVASNNSSPPNPVILPKATPSASPILAPLPMAAPSGVQTKTGNNTPTALIDPGHGGREIGSSFRFEDGTTLTEKDLNLKVALKAAELLQASGIAVIMTRTADVQINGARDLTGDDKVSLSDDLQARIDLANGGRAHVLVSVHFNGVNDPTKRGTQVFYADGRPFTARSRYLAEQAQAQILKQLKASGYESLDRKATADSGLLGEGSHFYLLGPTSELIRRPSDMPGIIGEALFLTNPDDANALRQPRILDALAKAYAEAVIAYFKQFPAA
jgi:N-acetylmuramoyl-L-alanine amidase